MVGHFHALDSTLAAVWNHVIPLVAEWAAWCCSTIASRWSRTCSRWNAWNCCGSSLRREGSYRAARATVWIVISTLSLTRRNNVLGFFMPHCT
jgi:hypothetical protein